MVHLRVCYYLVTHELQSQSTRYICLNIKEAFSRKRSDILNLSDCNGTRTHTHLVLKITLNHFAKPTK